MTDIKEKSSMHQLIILIVIFIVCIVVSYALMYLVYPETISLIEPSDWWENVPNPKMFTANGFRTEILFIEAIIGVVWASILLWSYRKIK